MEPRMRESRRFTPLAWCHQRRRTAPARGQAMVEYAVILALAIVIVIVVLTLLGNQVHNVFTNVSCAIGNLGGPCPASTHD